MLVKKIFSLFLIVYLFFSGFDPVALFYASQYIVQEHKKSQIVDKLYLASLNKNVVDNFFSIPKAQAALNPGEREYTLDIGPINGSTAANYVYTAFFNPAGSGRTASIKRVAIRSNTASSTAANYVNLSMRRISTSTGGTQLVASTYIYKNASTSDSVVQVRVSNPGVTLSGTTDSRILGLPQSGAVGARHSVRDVTFGSNSEKLILQPGEGIAVYQEAAGSLSSRVRVLIEWEETTNAPPPENEFLFAFPRVEVAAAAGYTYNSFFNPSASGKTAIVKRVLFGTETCDAAAVYTNNLILQRTSSATGGTLIATSSVPKKHTGGADTVMQFRRTGVTVSTTTAGGIDARIGMVTPCGAAGQYAGWQEINFHEDDEKLLLQEGEGMALITETAGDVDQLVRMIVEWEEVDTSATPAAQNEYVWSSDRVEAASAANTSHFTFFNPSGNTKTAVIKRLAIRSNADTTGSYVAFSFRRISAASGGTLVSTSSLPRKNTGSATSTMEVRWCGRTCASAITATYSGTTDSNFMTINGPGNVGQTIGMKEIVFGENEKIVLQPGEGIGFYNAALRDVDQYVKVQIEWEEVATPPASSGEYLITVGPVNGSTAASYNYVTFFNPSGSGKTAIIRRIGIRVDAQAAALYIPMQLRRLSAASGGTQITAANIPKKHTGTANSVVEIRRTGVTATYSGTADSRMLAIQTPGAVASSISGDTGYKEILFNNKEYLILQPGEGVGFYQDAAGDADFRVKVLFEWDEEVAAPSAANEYLFTSGPVNQSTANGYVYSSFFNPSGSGKNFLVKKLGVRVNRSGTGVAPVYGSVAVRKISAASAGTQVASTSIPKKHSGTATTTSQIRTTGVTVTLAQAVTSRLLGVTVPGVVNQIFGNYESNVYYGDELVLKEGEGIALYNEQTHGDALVRYRLLLEWEERSSASSSQTITFSISTSSVYFGIASPAQARYASSTDTAGSNIEVVAHTLSALTSATNGYSITIQGGSLSVGTTTIAGLGDTSSTSNVGTEQFGLRVTASGGSGAVNTPYAAAGYAFGASTSTTVQVASSTVGDSATTTFSLRYLLNIAPTTPAADYSTNLVYIATANF
jgi:hypothetical protein